MRARTVVAAALAATAVSVAPASAIEYDAGISGNITVYPDLSACATLSWPGGPVVGQFVAVGEVQGPGTKVGTVRSAVPVASSSGWWSSCVSGAYFGATAGEGKYTLSASGVGGDHVTVKQCTVTFGTLTCVSTYTTAVPGRAPRVPGRGPPRAAPGPATLPRLVGDPRVKKERSRRARKPLLAHGKEAGFVRLACALVAIAMLAPAFPATAAPPVPTLAGTSVIRASRPVAIDVRLPRSVAVRTPLNSSPDVAVSGGGPFTAVAIVGTDVHTKSTTLLGGAFADPVTQSQFLMPVHPVWGSASYETGKSYADEAVLPAGAYRVYVVPSGKPVTVTLRLRGLPGTAWFAASRAIGATVAYPPARLLGANGTSKNVYSAGATLRTTGPSLLFHGLWYDTAAHAAGQVFLCHGKATAEPVEAQPGCAVLGQGADANNDRTPTAGRDAKMHLHGLGPLPKGDWSLGFWYVTQSVVTDLRYVVTQIPL